MTSRGAESRRHLEAKRVCAHAVDTSATAAMASQVGLVCRALGHKALGVTDDVEAGCLQLGDNLHHLAMTGQVEGSA